VEDILVGSKAPDFSLEDFRGRRFSLSDYRGGKSIVLILLRGFNCRHTQWHLENLKRDCQGFQDLNAEVVAVGQHSRGEFACFWEKERLPFIGLPDVNEKVAKLYRQKIVFQKLGRLPAIFIINRSGYVVYANYCPDVHSIPGNEILLRILFREQCQEESFSGFSLFLPPSILPGFAG
jgi:peroxiredoxin Q/BCP